MCFSVTLSKLSFSLKLMQHPKWAARMSQQVSEGLSVQTLCTETENGKALFVAPLNINGLPYRQTRIKVLTTQCNDTILPQEGRRSPLYSFFFTIMMVKASLYEESFRAKSTKVHFSLKTGQIDPLQVVGRNIKVYNS